MFVFAVIFYPLGLSTIFTKMLFIIGIPFFFNYTLDVSNDTEKEEETTDLDEEDELDGSEEESG
jgi:hypothetical protein